MITLIIPTASRPAMLRTALESVASQTLCDRISRIIVSENGGTRASEEVCAEFPQLPVTYFFRTPSMTAMEHGSILMHECPSGDFTAILHDDDWWAPWHLANAIAALESHPQSGAYGASHFVVSGESSMLNCSGNLFPWFGAGYAPFRSVWELSRLNVLMAQLLGTISHYSSLVARTTTLKNASHIFSLGNSFDNDRMLMFALSAHGSVLFNPTPEVFVRNHGVQDCFLFDEQARNMQMCRTTQWMVESSGRSWDMIAKAFAKRMSHCPKGAVPALRALAMKEWCVPELKRHLQERVLV